MAQNPPPIFEESSNEFDEARYNAKASTINKQNLLVSTDEEMTKEMPKLQSTLVQQAQVINKRLAKVIKSYLETKSGKRSAKLFIFD